MADDRIPIYITMGDTQCIGHASRELANTVYRQNAADIHTEKIQVDEGTEAYTDEDGREHPAEPPTYEERVAGLKLKPFTVMAVTIDRGRVSRKQIMEERADEPEPFPEGTPIEDAETPERYGGITVGADDWTPTAGQKAEAAAGHASVPMDVQGMGPKEIDRLAAEHVADLSESMGGGVQRTMVPLIQSRSYSGHAWEWGDTHVDLDELWAKLDERGREWLYDEVMEIVQKDSPTPAQEEPVTKKLVGPGDATYDEMKRENIDDKIVHRRG
jgi:hypothetical protein